MNDPIIDYFEMNKDNYDKDNESSYKRYILNETNKYREKFLNKIIEISELNIKKELTINETIEKIKNNYPLIINGKLLNKKDNLIINCDIIIKNKLFRKLFPKIINIPFHLILKRDDYLLINLTYSTVNFSIDLKNINNDNLIFYKKCKLYEFQKIFNQYTNDNSKCFIMAKEYKYKNIILEKKDFIGYITKDEKIIQKIKNAKKWIQYFHNNFKELRIYPEPSCNELYPNMNNHESEWENEKKKLAEEIKEITLIWNISYEQRCDLINNNIKCWDNPKLLKELKETKNKNIQEKIIHINKQNDILISPRINISQKFKNILEKKKCEIFFDIESFLSFDEKNGLFDDIHPIKEPILAIIGLLYKNNYKDFTIDDFSIKSEEKIINEFIKYLHYISKDEIIYIYHWGHAEMNYFNYIYKNYSYLEFPKLELINILDYFRTEPIIIQGIFNFGLKSIGNALYKHKLIQTTWNKNDNGLETMINFKEICKNNNKNIPLKRYIEIKDIIEYNNIDCQVLYEIIQFLRIKYLRSS